MAGHRVGEIASGVLPSRIRACTPEAADPAEYDLVVLAIQESQYGADGVKPLVLQLAKSGRPCMAVMNMPTLPHLHRLERLSALGLNRCYSNPDLWDEFDPDLVTLASPDPQAFRPVGEPKNVLQVGLPTNFKVARFESEQHTDMLRDLACGIDAARFCCGDAEVDVPVRLKVHDSKFVPLAKWPMLIAGNYRCVRPQGAVSIRDAVWSDVEACGRIYRWVSDLCLALGASADDLVPFEKYAKAAQDLGNLSSVARALFNDAQSVERVDALVERIAVQRGIHLPELRTLVERVDRRLALNRAPARAGRVLEAVQ